MNARDRFVVGQAIVLSELGKKHFEYSLRARKLALEGEVVSFNRNQPDLLRVRLNGSESVTEYHHSFWDPKEK